MGAYDYSGSPVPDARVLAAMHAASPIAHLAGGAAAASPGAAAPPPLLLLLGLKDRRVPSSQGVELLHAARAAGIKAR